jgi:Uma2 family endonuclease
MSTATPEPPVAPKRYAPADLLEMDDAVRFELVDGQLVERDVSTESSAVAARIARLIGNVVDERGLGIVAGAGCGYQCFGDVLDDGNRIRKPDVSFISAGRLTQEQYQAGHTPIAPDLAVEVVSPNDIAADLDTKVEEYLSAGVRLVWVVYPQTKTVSIYGEQGFHTRLREQDELTAGDVIPDFKCLVAEVFPVFAMDER